MGLQFSMAWWKMAYGLHSMASFSAGEERWYLSTCLLFIASRVWGGNTHERAVCPEKPSLVYLMSGNGSSSHVPVSWSLVPGLCCHLAWSCWQTCCWATRTDIRTRIRSSLVKRSKVICRWPDHWIVELRAGGTVLGCFDGSQGFQLLFLLLLRTELWLRDGVHFLTRLGF